jgi:hypothetical protein
MEEFQKSHKDEKEKDKHVHHSHKMRGSFEYCFIAENQADASKMSALSTRSHVSLTTYPNIVCETKSHHVRSFLSLSHPDHHNPNHAPNY